MSAVQYFSERNIQIKNTLLFRFEGSSVLNTEALSTLLTKGAIFYHDGGELSVVFNREICIF